MLRYLWISGVYTPEAVTVCREHAFIDALVAFAKDWCDGIRSQVAI